MVFEFDIAASGTATRERLPPQARDPPRQGKATMEPGTNGHALLRRRRALATARGGTLRRNSTAKPGTATPPRAGANRLPRSANPVQHPAACNSPRLSVPWHNRFSPRSRTPTLRRSWEEWSSHVERSEVSFRTRWCPVLPSASGLVADALTLGLLNQRSELPIDGRGFRLHRRVQVARPDAVVRDLQA